MIQKNLLITDDNEDEFDEFNRAGFGVFKQDQWERLLAKTKLELGEMYDEWTTFKTTEISEEEYNCFKKYFNLGSDDEPYVVYGTAVEWFGHQNPLQEMDEI